MIAPACYAHTHYESCFREIVLDASTSLQNDQLHDLQHTLAMVPHTRGKCKLPMLLLKQFSDKMQR